MSFNPPVRVLDGLYSCTMAVERTWFFLNMLVSSEAQLSHLCNCKTKFLLIIPSLKKKKKFPFSPVTLSTQAFQVQCPALFAFLDIVESSSHKICSWGNGWKWRSPQNFTWTQGRYINKAPDQLPGRPRSKGGGEVLRKTLEASPNSSLTAWPDVFWYVHVEKTQTKPSKG